MKLTFFGRLRDAVGTGEIDCAVPPEIADSEALREWLGVEHPALLTATVRIALDDVMTTGPAPIAGAAEIAFLPPASGG